MQSMPYKTNREAHEGHKDFLTEGNKGNEELKALLRSLPDLLFKPVLVFLCALLDLCGSLDCSTRERTDMNGKLAIRFFEP